MLAIGLGKGSLQVCAAGADGAVLYRRALSRIRMAALMAEQPACVVAMEAERDRGERVGLLPDERTRPQARLRWRRGLVDEPAEVFAMVNDSKIR